MSAGIYLVEDDDRLSEMNEQGYASEDRLQELLARYPSLLPGAQIDSVAPRRWLLIAREAGVPSEEAGAGRWAVDLLLLDQDAVPTFVEVKRSSDTRIRREVVGQLLEYAANAVVYWPPGAMCDEFMRRCEADGLDAEVELTPHLDSALTEEDFWDRADTNLQAGKVRLVFAADSISAELQRIVEFLNERMEPTEVIAVEVKQFTGQGRTTLVPRLVGATAKPRRPPRPQWDEASFLTALGDRCGSEAVAVATAVIEWAHAGERRVAFGQGAQLGRLYPMLDHGSQSYCFIGLCTSGNIEVQLQWLRPRPPFDDAEVRRELVRRLNGVPGIHTPEGSPDGRPTFPITAVSDKGSLTQFLGVLEWAEGQVLSNEPVG